MAKAKVVGGLDEVLGKVGKEFGEMLSASVKGKKVNGTYQAINHIGNNYLGGAEYLTRGFKEGAWDLKKTFGKFDEAGKALNAAGKVLGEGEKQALNYGKIAGSYIGVSAATRIATGGGLYRDKNGNTDIIGIPFI